MNRKLILEISYDGDQAGIDLATVRLAYITMILRVGNAKNYKHWQNLWSMDQQQVIGRFKIESLEK